MPVALAMSASAVLGVCNWTVRRATTRDAGARMYHSAEELLSSEVETGRDGDSRCLAGGFFRCIGPLLPTRRAIPAVPSPALLLLLYSALPRTSPAIDLLRHHPSDTVSRL